jgi:hypothetical protein
LSVFSKQKGARLVNLLRLDRGVHSQPQEIVDRLLCREVEKLSKSQLPEPEDLYGLIASESEVVQTAAFTMLHRIIPEQQEQKSVDILLDKSGKFSVPKTLTLSATYQMTRCPSSGRVTFLTT